MPPILGGERNWPRRYSSDVTPNPPSKPSLFVKNCGGLTAPVTLSQLRAIGERSSRARQPLATMAPHNREELINLGVAGFEGAHQAKKGLVLARREGGLDGPGGPLIDARAGRLERRDDGARRNRENFVDLPRPCQTNAGDGRKPRA